jgi:hypothetical protein
METRRSSRAGPRLPAECQRVWTALTLSMEFIVLLLPFRRGRLRRSMSLEDRLDCGGKFLIKHGIGLGNRHTGG